MVLLGRWRNRITCGLAKADMKKLNAVTAVALSISLFFLIAFITSPIPHDGIVAGGDFYQLVDYPKVQSRYAYAWFNQVGQGVPNPLFVTYPYYLVISLLDVLLPSGLISSSIFFIFISFSFLSFLSAISILKTPLELDKKVVAALVYALNPFVLSVFTYSWGFTHHFLMYLFLPLLVAWFLRLLTSHKSNLLHWSVYTLCHIVALPSYGNISFLALLLLLYGLFSIGFLLLQPERITMPVIGKFLLLFTIPLILTTPVLIPIILDTLYSAGMGLTSQEALGGENYLYNWIQNTSNSPFNIFNLLLDSHQYPLINSPFKAISILVNSLFFGLSVFLVYLNRSKFKQRTNNTFLILSTTIYLTMCLLATRFFGPFEFVNQYVYLNPLFIFFRSPDKIFLGVSFTYAHLISLLLPEVKLKTWRILRICIVTALLVPYLIGTVPRALNNTYNIFAQKSLPEYSYILNIPREYRTFASKLNTNLQQTAILSLPYSVKNSINWSNYPKWKFVGHDILHLLFNRRYISANTFDLPTTEKDMSFRFTSAEQPDLETVMNNIQKFGTQYILYHKDIDQGLYNAARPLELVLQELQNKNLIEQIEENDYFAAYEVSPDIITPLISISNTNIKFKRINPTLYLIDTTFSEEQTLQFLQSFNSSWRLGLVDKTKALCDQQSAISYLQDSVFECPVTPDTFFDPLFIKASQNQLQATNHYACRDYANCWTIDGSQLEDKLLVIYYSRQYFVYALAILTTTCGILIAVTLGIYLWKNG